MKKDEEMDRQVKIHNTQKMIEEWKNELSTMAVSADLQPQTDAVNNELKKLQEERASIDSDISDLTAEKMNQKREEKSKLLGFLFSFFMTVCTESACCPAVVKQFRLFTSSIIVVK